MSFCLAINCIDGRVQEPLIKYIKKEYSCDYVTLITEPGPVQYLVDTDSDNSITRNIHTRINISLEAHNPKVIAIVAHEECAGNRQPPEIQMQQIKQARNLLALKYTDRPVIGLWIDLQSQVHKIAN